MFMKSRWLLFLLLVVLLEAAEQTSDRGRPQFAVASVRPSKSEARPEIGNSNGRGRAKNATLKMIMATAYQVPIFQISGGPAWVDSERFDIEAKAEDPKTGYIQLRLMMQSLLEDRFRLRLHRETRVSSVYFLVTSKGGARMSRSADQTSPDATGPPSSPADGPPRGSVLMGAGILLANAASMSVLAKVLTPELEHPVLDRTDLNGRYDVRLKWMPEIQSADAPGGREAATSTLDLPGLFTALREQLGLELKAGRGPVEFLRIDSAEKPSPN